MMKRVAGLNRSLFVLALIALLAVATAHRSWSAEMFKSFKTFGIV